MWLRIGLLDVVAKPLNALYVLDEGFGYCVVMFG